MTRAAGGRPAADGTCGVRGQGNTGEATRKGARKGEER